MRNDVLVAPLNCLAMCLIRLIDYSSLLLSCWFFWSIVICLVLNFLGFIVICNLLIDYYLIFYNFVYWFHIISMVSYWKHCTVVFFPSCLISNYCLMRQGCLCLGFLRVLNFLGFLRRIEFYWALECQVTFCFPPILTKWCSIRKAVRHESTI